MTTVVGSGTGANYPVVAGALCRLEENGLRPTHLIATSGSCLPFAFRAHGGHMRDFVALARAHPPATLIRPHWLWPLVPGLFHLDAVRTMIRPYVAKNFLSCTVPLTVIAFDSDARSELHYSTELTPGADVALAAEASMSIPWLMRHVSIQGVRATDGGSVHNFAIDLPDEPAVGIRVLGAASTNRPWRWWGSYSLNHVEGMLAACERAHIDEATWKRHKILSINSPISGMDFLKLDAVMIDRLFDVGYRAVDAKLAGGWQWRT